MSSTQVRIVAAGLFFLLIFITGFFLSSSGKPYSGILFTLHKLIALGAVVFLGMTVTRMHQMSPLETVQLIAIGVAGVCFAVTIITGGLLSTGQPIPAVVALVHRLFPYLTLILTAVVLYMLTSVSRDVVNVP